MLWKIPHQDTAGVPVEAIAMKNLSIVVFVLFVAYLADTQFFHGQYSGALTGMFKQIFASFGLTR